MENRYTFKQLVAYVVIAVTISVVTIFAILTGKGIIGPSYQLKFNPEDVSLESVTKFNQVKEILKNSYYQEVGEDVLLEGAVAGMAASLGDPYTVYFNKEHMNSFMEKSQGSYVGIGVSVNTDEDGILTVVEPFSGSPAAEAGMKQGDKILAVDDQDVTQLKDETMIISMIKGKEGTNVKIKVYRESESKYIDFELTRRRIKISNIKSEVLNDDIGYIKLSMFDSEIAEYFKNDLNSMMRKGIKALIIDLRDNPGGSFDQVVAISDMMLPEGLIVYTEDRQKNRVEKKSDKKQVDIPTVVLINGNSASASEILAGAIKDHNEGILIGTNTFGKGLVQELKLLDDGSGVKVTVSEYFTPSGTSIHGVGIKPDLVVEPAERYKNMPVSQIPREDDIQLEKAIEVLEQEIQ